MCIFACIRERFMNHHRPGLITVKQLAFTWEEFHILFEVRKSLIVTIRRFILSYVIVCRICRPTASLGNGGHKS